MQFEQELKKLNKAQRLAVETIEGPVMVVAGPGTGKTQVLTLRIANILKKTDTPAESVLALTFTESAVAAMRKRLVEIMGAEAYRVSIKTIHGFCNEVIQNYPEEFREISGAVNITEVDQIRLVRELLDGESSSSFGKFRIPLERFPLLRSFGDPYRNVRDIVSAISDLKREGKSPKEFEVIVKRERASFENIDDLYHEKGAHKGEMKGKYQTLQKQNERLAELAKLYAAYQAALRKQYEYDYDDMIMEVAFALETNRALRYTLQEKYLYILVDEHQDTNQAQNKVIELLASFHESPNLFVVGDEKQAIYRFQGASVENFTYFQERFKGAKLIALKDNYRSHQTILDAAFDVELSGSLPAGRQALKANAKHLKRPISLAAFSEPDVENYFLAADIKARIRSGVKPEEIAVLYRVNSDSAPIARMLEKLGVPFSIQSDEDIVEDYDIKKLLLLFDSIRNFGVDYALIPILYIDFLEIAPIDIVFLLDAAKKARSSVFVLIRNKKVLQKIVPESAEKLFSLYQKLSLWKAMSKNRNPVEVFEEVVRESGLLVAIANSTEKLAKVHTLFDQLKALVRSKHGTDLESFLEYLDIVREHCVRIRLQSTPYNLQAVRLMTAHKAKGQEFEYVYIAGATHGHWGSRRNHDLIKLPASVFRFNNLTKLLNGKTDLKDSPSQISRSETSEGEDERNLFYVALTRAKKEVVITYSMKNADGKDQLVSEFVTNIRSELVERVDISKSEKEFSRNHAIEFASIRHSEWSEESKEYKAFLRKRFLERGLTVSALNNYLQCPQKFYFVNLVGIPEASNKFALFGNAVHAALKFLAGKKNVTKVQLVGFFNSALRREPIGERDMEEMIAKGKKVLGAYYDHYYKSCFVPQSLGGGGAEKIFPEFSIDGVNIEISGKGSSAVTIPLRGRIDRIDFIKFRRTSTGIPKNTSGKGVGNEVTVVDYKTGRIKTRNEITGITKDSDGNFRRQLAFYALLLARGTKYRMKSGVIDFIEPDSRGKFYREEFVVEPKEVKELEAEIKRAAEEILTGKFEGCHEKDCRYCKLAS